MTTATPTALPAKTDSGENVLLEALAEAVALLEAKNRPQLAADTTRRVRELIAQGRYAEARALLGLYLLRLP